MSGYEEFEAIVSGQLPPDEWYRRDCATDFPELNPHSGVGQLTLEVAIEFGDAHFALEERRQQAREGVPFGEGELEALDRAWWDTRERWSVAYSLYLGIRGDLQYGQAETDAPVSYDQAVMNASQKELRRIQENHYHSWQRKESLIELSGRLAMLYRLETDCHFQELLEQTE